jgi:hypothetical protein
LAAATTVADYIDGYSIYSARLRSHPPAAEPDDPDPGTGGVGHDDRARPSTAQ